MGFRADVRAACVTLLGEYKDAVNQQRADDDEAPYILQIYPGRPRSVNPPCAFVDRISEDIAYTGPTLYQRTPRAEVVILHGLFDTREAVDQADAFTDGFLAFVTADVHAAGVVAVPQVHQHQLHDVRRSHLCRAVPRHESQDLHNALGHAAADAFRILTRAWHVHLGALGVHDGLPHGVRAKHG